MITILISVQNWKYFYKYEFCTHTIPTPEDYSRFPLTNGVKCTLFVHLVYIRPLWISDACATTIFARMEHWKMMMMRQCYHHHHPSLHTAIDRVKENTVHSTLNILLLLCKVMGAIIIVMIIMMLLYCLPFSLILFFMMMMMIKSVQVKSSHTQFYFTLFHLKM